MPEQKIVITIGEEGEISAKTNGFKGESCLEALNDLLDFEGTVTSLKTTDEFRQKQTVSLTRTQENKRS